MSVLADTHAVVWWLTARDQLSAPARAALEAASQPGHTVFVASISLVELEYLVEKGKLPAADVAAIHQALDDVGVALTLVPLDLAIARKIADVPRPQVPDMPDRIIAATALHLGLPLVSRDAKIRASNVSTIW